MVLLDEMPWLVADCLATHLPLESLCNVRLTCARLCSDTLHAFGCRYFRKRGVIVSRKSLQHLADIATNPYLASSVRVIEVSTMRLPTYLNTSTYLSQNIPEFLEMIKKMRASTVIDGLCQDFLSWLPEYTRPRYIQHSNEQRDLVANGTLSYYLSKAICALPNCTAIMLTDREAWGAKELARESGTPLVMDFLSENTSFTLSIWCAILFAISNTPAGVSEIATDFTYDVPEDLERKIFDALYERRVDLETTTMSSRMLRLGLNNITTLTLGGIPCQSTWWGGSVVSLISQFPRLLHCCINFSCIGDHGAVRELSEELFMPRIQELTLSMISMEEKALHRLLSRHRYTLQKVKLHTIIITGQGSWYSLLVQLCRDLGGLVLSLKRARYNASGVKRRVLHFHVK